jgi:type II secretory pathway component PulC
MTKQTSSSGTAFWLLASAGLSAAIVFQLNNDLSIAVPVTAAPADLHVETVDSDGVFSLVPPEAALLDAIVDRPLFSALRRPFEAPMEVEPAAAPVAVKTLSFKLAGTMLSGDARFALLAHPERGMLRLRQGQEVDGWRIEDVLGSEVLLRRGYETIRLRLQKALRSPKQPVQVEAQRTSQPAAGANTDTSEAAERLKE